MQRNDPDLYGADECNVDYDTAVCSDLIYSNSAQIHLSHRIWDLRASFGEKCGTDLNMLHVLNRPKIIQ